MSHDMERAVREPTKSTSAPLERAVNVLRAVANSPGGVRYSTLSKVVGLPRSTAYRISQTLIDIGILELSDQGETLHIGPALVQIAFRGAHSATLEEVWRTRLTALADYVGEATFLARLQGQHVEIVGIYSPSRTDLGGHVNPGRGVRPPHACSSAKAILAFQEEALVEEALSGKLQAFTHTTVQDKEVYSAELGTVRSQGYAECKGEIDEDIYSIAVPVFYEANRVEFCIGVVGTSSRICKLGVGWIVEQIKKYI